MTTNIRLAEAGDYPELTEIHNSQNPFKATAEQLLRADRRSAERDGHFRRAVVEAHGTLVAVGEIRALWGDAVQPGRYWLALQVAEPARASDIGTQLGKWLLNSVADEVRELGACIRSDFVAGMAWLQGLGFEERFVSWGAHLDLMSFDFGQFDPAIQRLETAGFRFVPYQELESADSEKRLLELQEHIDQDVLSFEPIVPSGREGILGPDYIRAGLIIAVNPAGEFVGLSSLRRDSPGSGVQTGLTGVHRDFRGMGIATAVKVRALAVAVALGASEIGTGGGGRDSPMKRLNQKLGFRVGPEWVTLISER